MAMVLSTGALLPQLGCFSFIGRELEALLAPGVPDNAVAVLNSVLFDLLVPLLF
jgi:hypothetical protein